MSTISHMTDATTVPQLWPFLLDLLTSPGSQHLVRWVSSKEAEFEFIQPEEVARLWGEQKANANMNFAKLSRALRNYYSLGLLVKVGGQQNTYKFTFDLVGHLGYSVSEICELIDRSDNIQN